MSEIMSELVIIVLLLVVNGLFAMSELAVVTARRSRLERQAESGDARARAALELAADPTQFLSTVQVGITLIGTIAGVFGGATIAEELTPILARLPALAPYSETVALALVVVMIAFLSLILGELVPKRIALGHPEAVARLVARPMRWLARIGRPVVWLLTGSTEMVLRLLRFRLPEQQHVTEDDVRALVAQATASGTVRAEEEEIVGRVLHLGDRPVAAVMTPRTDLSWVPLTAADDEVRRILLEEAPCWLLLCGDTVDDIIGVAGARDLLAGMVSGQPHDLGAAARIPLFVPEALTMLQLMEALRSSQTPVAIVLDEFGGVQGMVTFTDLVSHLVGDLSTGPADGPDVLRRPDGTWLIDAGAPLEEVEEALGITRPDGDARRDYHTVGGFVLSRLGHVPRPGEHVEYQGLRFEAVQLDGPRIVRILASALRPRRPDGRTSPPGTERPSAEETTAEKRQPRSLRSGPLPPQSNQQ